MKKVFYFLLSAAGLATSYVGLQSYGSKAYLPVHEAFIMTASAVTGKIVDTPEKALQFYVAAYDPNKLASKVNNLVGSKEEIHIVRSKDELVKAFSLMQEKKYAVSYREETGPNSYSGDFLVIEQNHKILIDKKAFDKKHDVKESLQFMDEFIIAGEKIENHYALLKRIEDTRKSIRAEEERNEPITVKKPMPPEPVSSKKKDKPKHEPVQKIPVSPNANNKVRRIVNFLSTHQCNL